MTTTDPREVTHADLITIVDRMVEDGCTPQEIAYAVEKPWKHLDWLTKTDD